MTYVRFYEKNPTVKQAVKNLLSFPADIRSVLAKGMCAIAESDFNAHVRMNDLKSLGKDTVLALYKSQEKRREYDTDPYLCKAMNYLLILEPSDQFFLAMKVNDLIQVVQEFMGLCKAYAQTVQLAIVERITSIYVRCGLPEAQDLLETIHTKFKHYFSKKEDPATRSSPSPAPMAFQTERRLMGKEMSQESIATLESGMHLRNEA
ncbi:hypothetical protein [Vampirovibrio sp.]|uniref:hypothetical protein n=1 Tax=Vampirovibrio sp. TaxID=2717857 RepID=UPI003593C5BB